MRKVLFTCLAFCLLCFSGSLFPVFSQEKTYTNSIGMDFVLIPAGTFVMGCDEDSPRCYDYEKPAHKVNISAPFYMGKYEVTRTQWLAVMSDKALACRDEAIPVVNVSWNDAQEFIRRLNEKEKTSTHRLPTEAEWEYAARAGSSTAYSFGDEADRLGEYAWFLDNSGKQSQSVGKKLPNTWGLYDMHGNVWEWVEDKAEERPGSTLDLIRPDSHPPEYRVFRGGGWNSEANFCRSSFRARNDPDMRNGYIGFRLVFVPQESSK